MSPKRKIPSRKFATLNQNSTLKRKIANRPRPDKHSVKRPVKPLALPVVEPTNPSIPQCFWDMGFESIPTLDQLRQRYKELSLVLHPDSGGSKEAFVALRENYESAQALLK